MKNINKKSKYEIQKKVVLKQVDEISKLKLEILNLGIDCDKRDEIIDSISHIRDLLIENIDDLRDKREEYNQLILELSQMKKIMNETVFKGRWKLIKLLLK